MDKELLLYDVVHDYIISENFASDTEGANKIMLKLSDELMQEIYERTMTASEKRKDTMLKKKYDDSDMKKNMQAQYGKEEGKKVYFATIRKQAMKKEEVESVEEKIKYDKSGSSMDYFLGSDPKKTEYYKKNAKKKIKKEEVEVEADKKGKGSGTKDACYHKVKASAKVWPSAYASGRLVQCRKKGASNYGKSKSESYSWSDQFDFEGEYVQEGKTFSDWKKAASKVLGKKDQERKPQKAMDAGARLRRKKERQEYAAKISGSEDNVPDEMRD